MQLREPFQPIDASEVIQYKFFNASVIADQQRTGRVAGLQRIDKLDIADMVSQVTALLSSSGHNQWRMMQLQNGYCRLDLVRGMEYVVDACFSVINNQTTECRKLRLVRPFGVMHLLTSGIFDESNLVHFVVAAPGFTPELRRFLSNIQEVCSRGSSEAYVMIVVCSNDTNEVEAVRSAVSVVQRRHRDSVHVRVIHTHRQFNKALALDLGSRQLPGSALIAFVDADIQFNQDALRRCRFHATVSHQVYYPIVFAQYAPDIVRQFSATGTVDNLDAISENTGV